MKTMSFASSRRIDGDGPRVSALGLGGWAIGGEMYLFGVADSYGKVDDAESRRAIHCALDLGINFFDTADCYGAGHSEEVLGEALRGRRERVFLATKFGYTFDAASRNIDGENVTPQYIRSACHASLRRLQTDWIDLYQIHNWQVSAERVPPMLETLEALCDEGLIRNYGWSTDNLECATHLVGGRHFRALQHEANVFEPNAAAIAFCRQHDLIELARSPLAMGLLSGRFSAATTFGPDQVRGSGMAWVKYFRDGRPAPEFLQRLEAVRELLRTGGRTLVQGALGYLWAKSERMIPIPGFRTVAQVQENAQALSHGPLDETTVAAIEQILAEEGGKDAGASADRAGAS